MSHIVFVNGFPVSTAPFHTGVHVIGTTAAFETGVHVVGPAFMPHVVVAHGLGSAVMPPAIVAPIGGIPIGYPAASLTGKPPVYDPSKRYKQYR